MLTFLLIGPKDRYTAAMLQLEYSIPRHGARLWSDDPVTRRHADRYLIMGEDQTILSVLAEASRDEKLIDILLPTSPQRIVGPGSSSDLSTGTMNMCHDDPEQLVKNLLVAYLTQARRSTSSAVATTLTPRFAMHLTEGSSS